METSDIFIDVVGLIVTFGLVHFAMRALIKAELYLNPQQEDGFLFRFKVTRAPMLLVISVIVFVYAILLPAYFPGTTSDIASFFEFGRVGGRALIVLIVAFPVILYNLFNYKRI